MVIRFGNTHLFEKDIRHVGIKMLPGVKDDFANLLPVIFIVLANRPAHSSSFDKLGAGAKNRQDFQFQIVSML